MPADTPLPAELEEALESTLRAAMLADVDIQPCEYRLRTLLSRIVAERDEARKGRDRVVKALAETLLSGDTLSFDGRRAYKRLKRGGMGGDEFHVEGVGTFDYSFEAVAALLKEGA